MLINIRPRKASYSWLDRVLEALLMDLRSRQRVPNDLEGVTPYHWTLPLNDNSAHLGLYHRMNSVKLIHTHTRLPALTLVTKPNTRSMASHP